MAGGATGVATSAAGAAATGTPIWDHAIDLNEDFRILWQIINQDITFEIQARTLGYVGFGFSPDGNLAGADMAIGWVDKGQTYFQVSEAQNKNPSEGKEKKIYLRRGTHSLASLSERLTIFHSRLTFSFFPSLDPDPYPRYDACGRKLRAADRPTK